MQRHSQLNRSDINVVAVDTDGEVNGSYPEWNITWLLQFLRSYTMGYKALENAVKYLDGEKVEDNCN